MTEANTAKRAMARLGRPPRTRVIPLANAARENDIPTDHGLRDDGNLYGWEMTLLSPTKFTNFVAHRCIGTWVDG